MNGHLSDNVLTIRHINATPAGTTDINGTGVDTQSVPADRVRAVCLLGALTATQVTSLDIEHSSDNSTWATLKAGTAAADADGNKILITDASLKGANRYIRATVQRATANAVVDGVVLEFYNVRSQKVTQDSTVSQLDLGT